MEWTASRGVSATWLVRPSAAALMEGATVELGGLEPFVMVRVEGECVELVGLGPFVMVRGREGGCVELGGLGHFVMVRGREGVWSWVDWGTL